MLIQDACACSRFTFSHFASGADMNVLYPSLTRPRGNQSYYLAIVDGSCNTHALVIVLVQVPTHFFKVIFTKSTSNGDLDKFAAFVVPNDSFEHRDEVNLQRDFLVRLTDLEAVTGILFLPDNVSGNHDMLDLITENMWMEDNGSNNKGGDPQMKGNKLLASATKMTKGRVTSVKKKLRKLKSDGEVIPKHFCAGERCDINIKIRK